MKDYKIVTVHSKKVNQFRVLQLMAQGMNFAGRLLMVMASSAMALSMMAPAFADAPREDVFNTYTTQPHRGKVQQRVPASAMPNPEKDAPRPVVTRMSSPQQWFEGMDVMVGYYRPNANDQLIISGLVNDEVERVTLYCNTLIRVAKNYRILAQKLKSLPVIDAMPQSALLRDHVVTWYNDSASVYEDMSRPRPPARTKEELAAMIKDVMERSETLKATYAKIWELDRDLRLSKAVNPPKYDDALNEYTRKSRPFGI
jgi:hypothetical protein